MIEGVVAMGSRRVVGHVDSSGGGGAGFCRGTEVTLELDDVKFAGTGIFGCGAGIDPDALASRKWKYTERHAG